MSCIVMLPHGSPADIDTNEGANEVLRSCPTFLSTQIKRIKIIRLIPGLNSRQDLLDQLEHAHDAIRCFSRNVDRLLFREKLAEAESKCWLEFAIDEIKKITIKTSWIEQGTLDFDDYAALQSCHEMFSHQVPVSLAFKSDFFQALTQLLTARQGSTNAFPSNDECRSIIWIVDSAFTTCAEQLSWSKERVFRKLEKTGILEQALRCSTRTFPLGPDEKIDMFLKELLDELQSCPYVLSQCFKIGAPCGDILRAIIAEDDEANEVDPPVINRLHAISYLSDLTNETCNWCWDVESSECPLKMCSRCNKALYCSIECQNADWRPHHRQICVRTAADAKEVTAVQRLVNNYFNDHYRHILPKMVEECNSKSLTANKMVVEVDFMIQYDVIPAIHDDTPLFNIAPLQAYIDGTERPCFLIGCHNPDLQKDYLEKCVSILTESASSKSFNTCLFLVIFANLCIECVEVPMPKELWGNASIHDHAE
ncbi:unnamed protein product [Cylindrotheca closterium]|uniref:MYND-type domain-containing protein n=1 Tax=Cylindrotheca closterium TaxID=2856 RepID=A0AAD2JJ21_9STRA|nr:unnamed protein product [Cylindrotheca closterium]